jgi:hypothetical protein
MLHSASFHHHPQDSTRILGWGGCAAREVPDGMIHLDTRERHADKKLGIWLGIDAIPSEHD